MLKTFLIAWPFCFLLIDFIYWIESRHFSFQQSRNRIMNALGGSRV